MQMAKSGSTDDALRVLEKSDSDAKLAQALGVEGTTRSQLQSVLDQIKTLKAQLGR
jgi:hypothetical protein